MQTLHDLRPFSDHDMFACGPYSYANGFAQIDTSRVAPYLGTWCSPAKRTIVDFNEGDLTTRVYESDEEFVEQLRELARWNDEAGYGPMKIDTAGHEQLRQAFEKLGISDLVY